MDYTDDMNNDVIVHNTAHTGDDIIIPDSDERDFDTFRADADAAFGGAYGLYCNYL